MTPSTPHRAVGRDAPGRRHGRPGAARSPTARAAGTPSRSTTARADQPGSRPPAGADASPTARAVGPAGARRGTSRARLNPKYTFETFVIGSSQPVRPRGRRRRGRGARPRPTTRCSSTASPGWARPTCCTPSATTSRNLYTGVAGPLRDSRGVHQRLHQRDPRRQGRGVPAPLPRGRRPADRRHPVPGGQGADAGGVLPHLQHAAQRQQADRDHLRPAAQAAGDARGPAAQPVRVGPDHRRPAARPRDPDRDPAQEGRPGAADRAAGRARVHRQQDLRPTSASSRAR